MRRPANRGLYPQKNVVGKTLDLGDTVLMGTATRFTRPLTRVRGQDFQRAGGSPRGRERLPQYYAPERFGTGARVASAWKAKEFDRINIANFSN